MCLFGNVAGACRRLEIVVGGNRSIVPRNRLIETEQDTERAVLVAVERKSDQLSRDLEELEELEVEGTAGGGQVKVFLSGNQEPRRVEIAPAALEEGAEMLSDLVLAAMKDAYERSTATMRDRMEELTGGLNLPGM